MDTLVVDEAGLGRLAQTGTLPDSLFFKNEPPSSENSLLNLPWGMGEVLSKVASKNQIHITGTSLTAMMGIHIPEIVSVTGGEIGMHQAYEDHFMGVRPCDIDLMSDDIGNSTRIFRETGLRVIQKRYPTRIVITEENGNHELCIIQDGDLFTYHNPPCTSIDAMKARVGSDLSVELPKLPKELTMIDPEKKLFDNTKNSRTIIIAARAVLQSLNEDKFGNQMQTNFDTDTMDGMRKCITDLRENPKLHPQAYNLLTIISEVFKPLLKPEIASLI